MNQKLLDEALNDYDLYNIDFESKEFKESLSKIVLSEATKIVLKRVMSEAITPEKDMAMVVNTMFHIAQELGTQGPVRGLKLTNLMRALRVLSRGDREYLLNPVSGEIELKRSWLNPEILARLKAELRARGVNFLAEA